MSLRLNVDHLRRAMKSGAAIRRIARLQPAGGSGDKVFPPTYAGGIDAEESRVPCIFFDRVQAVPRGALVRAASWAGRKRARLFPV